LSLIAGTFHLATLGNGIVAIASGLLASFVATNYGYVSPFMLAIVCLVLSAVVVTFTWNENYGDQKIEIIQTFTNAIKAVASDKKILVLGVMQSLFEASMYTFVFMWSPCLDEAVGASKKVPYGLVFACFMVAIMLGSFLFSLSINRGMRPEVLISLVYLLATCTFIAVLFFKTLEMLTASFLLFEVCCGIFFPCIATLRGKYIDEKTRASVMSFFRMPLNLLVVVVLLKVSELTHQTVFAICTSWLFFSFVLSYAFNFFVDAGNKQDDEVPTKNEVETVQN